MNAHVALAQLRAEIRAATLADERDVLTRLRRAADLSLAERAAIASAGADLVRAVRSEGQASLMETFLSEYGLSTKEGVALMCLAEALLRVPDSETIDALIADKIVPSDWGAHLGRASSSLVNASTWALMLTGRVLAEEEKDEGVFGTLRGLVRRLGEPIVRTAVAQAMRELGRQFVLGRSIEEAALEAKAWEEKGYRFSYDMLGEGAKTEADARRYHLSYSHAIGAIARAAHGDVRANPGISVKLSALHPRYETARAAQVRDELVPRLAALVHLAASAGIGLNVDAEEADRLDLSLDVIEAVAADRALRGWDGFGVVVQAYGRRALPVLDWVHGLADRLDRRVMVRLVKGAYWDSEIKRAQALGLAGFPVFTRKATTDISYIAGARRLFAMAGRVYPQFATHNAHTVAAVLALAPPDANFEFQRLHGMGEALHETVRQRHGARCRIYAPVGEHRDLLAYLVRRLLENGANSSFVHQIVNEAIAPETIARDPFAILEAAGADLANPRITPPARLFADRTNSAGLDLQDPTDLARVVRETTALAERRWSAAPMLGQPPRLDQAAPAARVILNPARPADQVGAVREATPADVEAALAGAEAGFATWSACTTETRARILINAADLYQAHADELRSLLVREAGKALSDAVSELREAIDFLRYYAGEARRLDDAGTVPLGTLVCISPWNFPLAIFTGQVAAGLAAGSAVIAKPAEQTPLIAARAVLLLHEAGVPAAALQLLPGDGPRVGASLTRDRRVSGIVFTGSTEVATLIDRAMAEHLAPDAPLIAETGGINAMIVDSTALPEQVVRDVLASAFQSAGQRCSALRVLYLQKDVAEPILEMLTGAMALLKIGDPSDPATDIGPMIDADAKAGIEAYLAGVALEGRLITQRAAPAAGTFIGPALVRVSSIEAVEREVFGPVLHVATYAADELDGVIAAINAKGYGLTGAVHSRVDARVQQVVAGLRVGNLYVNRNQIGAVVGSQPFGGEGLSGTGPKAGGPFYLRRLRRAPEPSEPMTAEGGVRLSKERIGADLTRLAHGPSLAAWRARGDRAARLKDGGWSDVRLDAFAAMIDHGPRDLPGPTGESNRLGLVPRSPVLCLGPSANAALDQAALVLALGGAALVVAPGTFNMFDRFVGVRPPGGAFDGVLAPEALTGFADLAAVMSFADEEALRACRRALAAREGARVPLVTSLDPERLVFERHLCIDTTAAGGNASLLAEGG